MRFQLSTILSLSVLAFFSMSDIAIVYDDSSIAQFNYGDCLEAIKDDGTPVSSAQFSDNTVCNVFHEPDCNGASVPVPLPATITVPNPFGSLTVVIRSARCKAGSVRLVGRIDG
ncbi:hypothetical protein M422DRAFT_272585 [Sphaerobolus stellatus SS14]|uniref:Uncharacterized protein n=1 Tax=Sphaerobolus stellatus (strain SS14) TaxID=990650 RepID=A0A0C9ULM6_SPHS4|nr:hypothetical protein M422DRAFT_272585 [Sphaerobolus stellatus SS14]